MITIFPIKYGKLTLKVPKGKLKIFQPCDLVYKRNVFLLPAISIIITCFYYKLEAIKLR